MHHLEKFEANVLKRPVVSARSIPLSPKKLSSSKEQEDKQMNKRGIGLGLAISQMFAKMICPFPIGGIQVKS